MTALASSSSSLSPSGSRPRPRKDVFKPKFPLDPFHGHSAAALGEPWFLKIDALLSATALQRQNVIFVLGAPSLAELGPLLQSQRLAKSLVILATHNPPDIPGIVYPTVRILRLTTPLALEDAGAVRFVNVLEWAERVARTWRKHGSSGVCELSEEQDNNGELKPPSIFRLGTRSASSSPRSSTIQLPGDSSATISRPLSRPPSVVGALFSRQSHASLPPSDPFQRPFDVMVNFMPVNLSDKALLKNSILVTTISRPFLKSPVHGSGAPPPTLRTRTTSSSSTTRLARPQSIFSAFSRSTSSISVYLPPTPPYESGDSLPLSSSSLPAPPGKALLVHLLPSPPRGEHPAARRKLVDSMEAFLLSFSYQSTGLPSSRTYSSPAGAGPGLGGGSDTDRARPYVMHTSTFCDTVGCDPALGVVDCGEWSVADIVLSGALDADTVSSTSPAAPPPAAVLAGAGSGRKSKRAWIAAAADLVILPSSDNPTPGPSSSLPSGTEEPPVPVPAAERGMLQPSASSPSSPSSKWLNRATRSTSAPLLSADWTPVQFGGRPMSHPSHQQQSMPVSTSHRHPLAHLVAEEGERGSGTTFRSSPGHTVPAPTPTPPATSRSSTAASSLGPPTPPHSSEEGELPLDAIKEASPGAEFAAPRHTMGVAVMAASTVDISSVEGEGGMRGKGTVKVAKWKYWRRKTGANVPSAAVVA
ncbi:hypothetical protein BD309DRAFT_871211 [Dichomitus squalens]|uniref:Uncharacterized protein n=1 Tax=Dichomitus squalens TaxID=114155 RepID=A0A4Q9PF10_9APHY|nr:hypothetical protein BD309DRAFT_871211 [Dichomitus squalens]TBU53358.1 hypothetical protein BD310DRAFT_909538 [Dichomitus squalens]